MGIFDSVYVICPHCGGKAEFQSKADIDPYMNAYTLESAPRHILEDVINHPVYHEACGNWLALVDRNYPPFTSPPLPSPVPCKVRPPAAPMAHQKYRWWPDDEPFGEEHLVGATTSALIEEKQG